MTTVAAEAPTRFHAGLFDFPVEGPLEYGPGAYSPEAIGGSYSVEWTEWFKDAKTGKVYGVRCSDGVYGGHSSRSPKDEKVWQNCYYSLVERFAKSAEEGKTEILISRNERAVMQGFTHATLLEEADGTWGKQSKLGFDGGLVGHYHGIPVICDLQLQDTVLPKQE
jgi:hypothetical protein